jgi:hypothetical protein
MRRTRFILAIAIATTAGAGTARPQANDALRFLELSRAEVVWTPNQAGGKTPSVVYTVRNTSNGALASIRQLWVLRVGRDSTIAALRGAARQGKQYAVGSERSTIGAGQSMKFSQAIPIGGYPSGTYQIQIELRTPDGRRAVTSLTVNMTVP